MYLQVGGLDNALATSVILTITVFMPLPFPSTYDMHIKSNFKVLPTIKCLPKEKKIVYFIFTNTKLSDL